MEGGKLEVDILKSSLPAITGDFMGGIFGGELIRDQELSGTLLTPC